MRFARSIPDWMARTAGLCAVIAMVIILSVYGREIRDRRSASECRSETEGRYVGEVCVLASEYGTLFRLYDASSGELLAERKYYSPQSPQLLWSAEDVCYDVSDDDGYVSLPPTWLDRLRAKLP